MWHHLQASRLLGDGRHRLIQKALWDCYLLAVRLLLLLIAILTLLDHEIVVKLNLLSLYALDNLDQGRFLLIVLLLFW
jgi:hypothetical protein